MLFDLKSAALEMLLPRLGLTDPERFMFCIQQRIVIPPLTCPYYDFTIIQRNWDPVTLAPTKYVNGNLFTYTILILCPPAIEISSPEQSLVDPLDQYETSVSSAK